MFVTSSARRTWYDGVFLTLDKPYHRRIGSGRFNLAYTYAKANQTGTDNPGEGIAFGAFDYLIRIATTSSPARTTSATGW